MASKTVNFSQETLLIFCPKAFKNYSNRTPINKQAIPLGVARGTFLVSPFSLFLTIYLINYFTL